MRLFGAAWMTAPLLCPLTFTPSFYHRDSLQLLCGQDPNCYLSYQWNRNMQYAFIYHFFGLLWTNQFIVGLSCVTIAGEEESHAVAKVYLIHGTWPVAVPVAWEAGTGLGIMPIVRSFWTVLGIIMPTPAQGLSGRTTGPAASPKTCRSSPCCPP